MSGTWSLYSLESDQVENWDGSWLEDEIEEFDQQWNDIEDVNQFINSIGANITLDNSNSAFYRPSTDSDPYVQIKHNLMMLKATRVHYSMASALDRT